MFRCDGKWEANHVYIRKELSVLLMEGEFDEEALGEDDTGGGDGGDASKGSEVSLYSMVGLTHPKTMRLWWYTNFVSCSSVSGGSYSVATYKIKGQKRQISPISLL